MLQRSTDSLTLIRISLSTVSTLTLCKSDKTTSGVNSIGVMPLLICIIGFSWLHQNYDHSNSLDGFLPHPVLKAIGSCNKDPNHFSRESVGAGSEPVGDIVEVGTTSSPHLPSDQWNRHHRQSYHQSSQSRRFDSTELADSSIRTDAIKLVRELNNAVASHVALATLLGGSGDGPHLRDELRRARRTAQESAAAAKSTLLPPLLDQLRWAEKERTELERLWYLLLCCLDALELSMHRCLALLREFSSVEGCNVVIHTGIDCPNHFLRSQSSTTTAQSVDLPFCDRSSLEGVEASQLCKELFELRVQLQELKTTLELRSLSVPDFNEMSIRKSPNRTDTLISINGTDGMGNTSGGIGSPSCSIPSDDKESIESETSQGTGITNAQRKCICWILGIMVAMFFLAMILGVFIALCS